METLVLREERPSFNYLNDFGGFWKPGDELGILDLYYDQICDYLHQQDLPLIFGGVARDIYHFVG